MIIPADMLILKLYAQTFLFILVIFDYFICQLPLLMPALEHLIWKHD